MNFNLREAIEVLERTPPSLEGLLSGLSAGWLHGREGEGTWNALEVIEHLIEGEKTNWVPRLEWMFREGENGPFPPFDRFSHLERSTERTIQDALPELRALRTANIARLRAWDGLEGRLDRIGLHPEFGAVTARQLLSTWVVHDLAHLAQIARVMAKRYGADVGPWNAYLSILSK